MCAFRSCASAWDARRRPALSGNAEAEGNDRLRRVLVYGSTSALVESFNLRVKSGQSLPAEEAESARNFVVLGAKLKQELFGAESPLGARVRVGSLSFRVIGVMEARGLYPGGARTRDAALGSISLLVGGLGIGTIMTIAVVALAEVLAVGIGLVAGVQPARRASRLDPVEALRAE